MKHCIKGVTLIELMVTLTVFSIIFGMVYSVYNTFIRQASIERKTVKTELDILSTFWPMTKDIEGAGFGTSSTGLCGVPLSLSGGELIIHSTAGGADRFSGRWSYITGQDCTVSGLQDLPNTENVIILSGDPEKKCLGFSRVQNGKLISCNPDQYRGQFAYWIPDNTITNCSELNLKQGCYELRFGLGPYYGDTPEMCKNTGIQVMRKSLSTTTTPNRRPFIDCVLALDFRFGYIDGTVLNWYNTPSGSGKLRFVKIGMVIQSSPRKDIEGPASITLFEDTGLPLTINLNNEQRFYRWRILEQTVILRNN